MKAISLFSGIGGDTLATQWAGFKTIQFVENDLFCQKILKKHWPGVPIWGDIDGFKAEQYRGQIALVHGGDPCQPNSLAGKRRGTEDDRYKWPKMFRIISECQPTWVVSENPPGRLTMDFHEVLSDLESQGYETRSFVIPACAVNAPHKRERLYVIANNYSHRQSELQRGIKEGRRRTSNSSRPIVTDNYSRHSQAENKICTGRDAFINGNRTIANTASKGFQRICQSKQPEQLFYAERGDWQKHWAEVATSLCGMDDGLPNRVARLKALGNAQVPQQVYPIYKAIVEVEKANNER